MTRTFVTGVAGFTGRYLAAVLSERGHEVHGLVTSSSDGPVEGVSHFHEGDVRDGSLERILSDVSPDHIVHLAAIAFVGHADVAEMYGVNLLGTRHLLEAAARLEKRPASILLASSANVYGNAREGVYNEETPIAPANDYAVTKAAMELVAQLYSPRLPIIIARPFNYTGRGQGSPFIIPNIGDQLRRGADAIHELVTAAAGG